MAFDRWAWQAVNVGNVDGGLAAATELFCRVFCPRYVLVSSKFLMHNPHPKGSRPLSSALAMLHRLPCSAAPATSRSPCPFPCSHPPVMAPLHPLPKHDSGGLCGA